MSNESAITFWLENRQVNGLLVAESGVEKLVQYGGRFYVVKDKDPGKRHYTQRTLPLLWRKILAEKPLLAPPAPEKDDSPPIEKVRPVRVPRTGRKQMEEGTSPGEPAAAATLPRKPEPPEAVPALEQTPSAPVAKGKGGRDKASPLAAKRSAKQEAQSPAAGTEQGGPQEAVRFNCPYCARMHEIGISAVKVDKPFFQPCSGCGKDFGVRVVTTLLYQAEVAGFVR